MAQPEEMFYPRRNTEYSNKDLSNNAADKSGNYYLAAEPLLDNSNRDEDEDLMKFKSQKRVWLIIYRFSLLFN